MPSLRFKIRGVEFELVGEQNDIIRFINGFMDGTVRLPSQAKLVSQGQTISVEMEESGEAMINKPLPPDKDVIRYITSKADFNHDIFEIQRHFYGQEFRSRGNTKRMYHKTARQLRLIRKEIEKKEKGEFVGATSDQGVKQYTFRRRTPHIGWGKQED